MFLPVFSSLSSFLSFRSFRWLDFGMHSSLSMDGLLAMALMNDGKGSGDEPLSVNDIRPARSYEGMALFNYSWAIVTVLFAHTMRMV